MNIHTALTAPVLSSQQQAVVDWVRNGRGNALVRARAGTGKTFLLLQAMRAMNGGVGLAAYNNKIAKEVAFKAEAQGLRADVKTFHAFGFAAVRKAFNGVKIEGNGKGNAGYFKFERIADEVGIPVHLQAFVKSAVSLAKQRAIGFEVSLNDRDAWLDMIRHYDLEQNLSEEFDDLSSIQQEDLLKEGCQYAVKALRKGIEVAREVIDFDDMIYMPLVNNLRVWQYDWLLVDEAQDTNPARRALARKLLRTGGRAIFVGDDRQAIYGFTGADNDSLDIIKGTFGAREFPLTVTFRCPKAVVGLAQGLVADYEAAPQNIEGSVQEMTEAEFGGVTLTAEDAIICRNTKPLVKLAFGLIRRGIPCHVEGKEIGKGLIALANRWKSVKTIPTLKDKLVAYRDREVAKLLAKGKEMQAEGIEDRVDSLIAIIDGCGPEATLADVKAKIEDMFADTPNGERPARTVLMTAHRSKGLEFPRVFIYGRARFMPSKYARQQWQLQQEENLEYVAITRAQETLVDVIVPPPAK